MPSDTGNITVFGRGPNYDRFRIAHAIQNACNPSGVAYELVRVIEDAMRDPKCTGGTWVCADPAVVAVVDKLSSLMRLDAFEAHRLCSMATKEGAATNFAPVAAKFSEVAP